jgi:hypothetical protein
MSERRVAGRLSSHATEGLAILLLLDAMPPYNNKQSTTTIADYNIIAPTSRSLTIVQVFVSTYRIVCTYVYPFSLSSEVFGAVKNCSAVFLR